MDRVQQVTPGREIVTTKAVTGGEPCYAGLPEDPGPDAYCYPRSLMLESFGQSAALLWLASAVGEGIGEGVLMLAAVRECRFTSAVQPGELLHQVVRLEQRVGPNAFFTGETWSGNRCVATIETLIAASRPAEDVTGQTVASSF